VHLKRQLISARLHGASSLKTVIFMELGFVPSLLCSFFLASLRECEGNVGIAPMLNCCRRPAETVKVAVSVFFTFQETKAAKQ
jgi:hypothetical protein